MNRLTYTLLLTTCLLATAAVAQENRWHNVGELQVDISAAGQDQNMVYSADFSTHQLLGEQPWGHWVCAADFVDENGTTHSKTCRRGGPAVADQDVDNIPVYVRKYVKRPYPTVVVDGTDVTLPSDYEEVRPDLPSDVMIEARWKTSLGVTVTSRSYSWSHPDYDDFVLVHYALTNTGDVDRQDDDPEIPANVVKDFYFVVGSQLFPGEWVDHVHQPGDHSYWMDYYGDEAGDSIRVVYYFDGDDPKNGREDEGNPHIATGEFLTPQYAGWSVVHADVSATDRRPDPAQPRSVWRVSRYGPLTTWGEAQLYDQISGRTFPDVLDIDAPGADPRHVQQPFGLTSFGPYSLQRGETVNVVIAKVAGMQPTELNRDMGARWIKGEITDAQKNDFLRGGREIMFRHAGRAQRVWENGLQLPGGPNLPPPERFEITSGGGEVDLEWSPVDGAQSYRLYRALGRRDSVLYEPLASGLTETTYKDQTALRGFAYYYNVTAVDARGVESGRYYVRSSRKSAVPYARRGDTLDDVRVVPNPFVYDPTGQTNYTGERDKLMFAGLPGPCTIRIYTVSGDLVEVIEHESPEGTHEWFGITRYNQYVASGVYMYQVESKEGKGTTMGKFIVIR